MNTHSNWIGTRLLVDDEDMAAHDLRPGEELCWLGFLFGLESNTAGFPILRSGRIASFPVHPSVRASRILLDMKIFGGNSGGPVFFDFEEDPQTATVEDQFLFGPDLLIAPITTYRSRSREVYLPAGTDWTDAWSGATLPGGQSLLADAPLEHIPVYVRGHNPSLLRLFDGLYKL